jgi:hypothetical protein
MANRYWVGGTASWDGTAGSKWALTSGGAGGQAVPTAADDVFFDAASGAVTCTITYAGSCLSLNFTGFTGTFAGGSGSVTLNGDLTLAAAMSWTQSGGLIFQGSGTKTITSNGRSITAPIGISTLGIVVQLADAFSTTSTIQLTSGTFTTNNFNVTAASLLSSNSNTRTINLGSSTVTLGSSTPQIQFSTNTNLTFNAGTSTIAFTAFIVEVTGGAVNGTGVTFYNLSFSIVSSQFQLVFHK